ncbi:carbohydrate binding domain-containing protein [Candidatus Micrarchaeota archaeon]|nr:carbohydrate binding domain-containing protein [Candidatus Micrarchaeota archaeon]
MIDGAAPASACQERFYTELKKDAQKLNALFLNPPAFFVGYDEWRLANWDPACKDINGEQDMTGGQYMAYAMNRTEKLIKEVRPDAEVIVWADMFDPFHNAVPNYYAVRGTVEGAWEGVSPNTIIMNWGTRQNNDTRTNEPQSWSSLKFFAGRGNHQMIAGYYDTGDRDFFCDKWWLAALNALENTSEGISDIDGYMYTTFGTGKDWYYGNYDDLEAVAELMKSRGRWGTNTLVDYDNINVVSNPGFEEGMTNWSVANDPSKGQTVEDIVHSGNKSLRIQNYNSSTYPIAFQSINLVPNSSYFLSGWVKTGELSASGASYNQATIAYEWTALNGRWGSGVYTFVKANSDWTKAQYSFVLPTNYSRGNVILYLPKAYDIDNKVTTGTAWFDDISITSPVSFYVIIRYPTYRNTIYPGQEKKVTVGVRTARTHFLQISDYSIELTFFDSNNQTISRITEPYDGSQPWNSYSVDLSNYPSGNYSVLVKLLLKINGFELKSKNLSFKIAEPTTPFPKVYIDENNRIVVDGELFFPLGFYHSASLNETIAVLNRLNNSKFNTMLSYASNWWGPKAGTDFLNAAQNKSIKIIYSVKDCFNGSRYIANNTPPWKGTTGVLTGLVSFFKNHSALLGWYMNDELTDKYLPQLQENYELIKSIDPDHPALQILYTSEPLDLHVNNTDVIGIDHYPVLASRLNQPKLYEFGESTKKIATTVMNSRGIWMVPECSSQKSYFISLGRNPNETRAPTYEEMMALSYQGLVFGARGLIFYQLSILLNENGEPQWEVMKRVGEQLDSIKPIVLGIDAPAEKSVSSSSPKISVLTRLVGDEVYALAVNPYYENNSATFTIGSGLNAERIEVGLPGVPQRTIALNSLSFSDELESLGTRVYRIILPSIPSGSIPNQPGPGGSSGPGVPGGSSNRTTTTSNETSTTASETSTSLECDVNQTKCVESNAGNFLFACIGGAWKNTKECSAGCTKIGVGGTCRQETNETLVSAYSRILAEVNTLLADAKVAGLDVSSEESELKKAVGFKSAGDYSNAVETVLKARKSLQSKLANAPKEVLGLDAQRTIGLSGVALALVFLVYSYVRRRRKETRPPYLLSKTQKESAGNW